MGDAKKLPRGVTVHRGKLRVSFAYRGVRCRESLGLLPTGANVKHAKLKRDIVLQEIALDKFDYGAHFPDSPRAALWGAKRPELVTVASLLDRFMAAATLAPSTRREYEGSISHHLKPKFGALPVTDLRASDVRVWLQGLTCSNKRKNNVMVPLRGALNMAVEDELIDRSPLDRVRNLEVRLDEPDPLEPDEIERLLGAMDASIRRMFQFAIWTGLRTGELIAIAWEDIDLEQGVARIHRNRVRKLWKGPKTAAGVRLIDLQDDALEALKGERATSQARPAIEAQVNREGTIKTESFRPVWLNPRTGEPWLNDQQLRRRAWDPAVARSKIRYRTPYQTRHTFASLLLSWGVDPTYIAAQMGHKDWGMIRRRYARWIRAMSTHQRDIIRQAKAAHFGELTTAENDSGSAGHKKSG